MAEYTVEDVEIDTVYSARIEVSTTKLVGRHSLGRTEHVRVELVEPQWRLNQQTGDVEWERIRITGIRVSKKTGEPLTNEYPVEIDFFPPFVGGLPPDWILELSNKYRPKH